MKKALLFIVFLVSTFTGLRAQPTLVFAADTTRKDIDLKTLDKEYTPIERLLARNSKEAHELMIHTRSQFQAFLKQRRFSRFKVNFRILEYDEPTGHVAYAFLEWDKDAADSIKRQVIQLVKEYYQLRKPDVTSSMRFRASLLFDGQTVPKRSARSGAGAINTLEAAQKTTQPDTVKILYFNQLGLEAVPEVVYRFPNLSELDLSNNNLRTVPARLTADLPKLERLSLLYNAVLADSLFITPNKHLKALNIQGNGLTGIPVSVRRNQRLESLWAGNNQLETVDLRGLRRLKDLNLYNVGLATFPSSVTRLRRLQILDLYYNKIQALPPQLGRLRKLEQLAVSHNSLRELPARLSRLKRLQVLYAHHNQIGTLPDRFDRLRRLRLLDLGYNFFSTTPPVLDRIGSLEELDLNSNNLQELSPGLLQLANLKKLYLRSNPITDDRGRVGSFTQTIRQLEARKTEVFH